MTAAKAPLLPPNATVLDRAIEAVGAARYPLPVDLIRSVWNPDTCPAHLLGYLAWQLSVDLWDEAWPETKKRSVCRHAYRLHRIKTTPAGIKAHVALTGAEVVQIIRPPARQYLGRSMTPAEREAWLGTLPQIRIYPYWRKATAHPAHIFCSRPGRRFYLSAAAPPAVFGIEDGAGIPIGGQSSVLAGEPLPRRFPLKSRGFDIYRRRATYFDQGVEVDAGITLDADGVVERIALRREASPVRLAGYTFLTGTLVPSKAAASQISVRIGDDAPAIAVPPGARPVDVRPQRVVTRRIAQPGRAFVGHCHASAGHMLTSAGPLLIYDRIAFAVPSRVPNRIKATAFAGHGRLGIKPFHAELRIKIRMKRPRALANRFMGHGWLHTADMSPVYRALEAVRVSKAARDKILVSTTTMLPAQFGASLRFGEFNFGDMRKVV